MEVVASEAALEYVRQRGGKLFVSMRTGRCCSGATSLLDASTEPADRDDFRPVAAPGIDLYVSFPRLPERLEIDVVGRFPRRIAAFWNGCVWVV